MGRPLNHLGTLTYLRVGWGNLIREGAPAVWEGVGSQEPPSHGRCMGRTAERGDTRYPSLHIGCELGVKPRASVGEGGDAVWLSPAFALAGHGVDGPGIPSSG
eukprot:scaffold30600_cov115-Isochrysis_galbana.AAC.2